MRLSRSHPETLPAWMKSKTAVFMLIVKKKTILGGWSEAIYIHTEISVLL